MGLDLTPVGSPWPVAVHESTEMLPAETNCPSQEDKCIIQVTLVTQAYCSSHMVRTSVLHLPNSVMIDTRYTRWCIFMERWCLLTRYSDKVHRNRLIYSLQTICLSIWPWSSVSTLHCTLSLFVRHMMTLPCSDSNSLKNIAARDKKAMASWQETIWNRT